MYDAIVVGARCAGAPTAMLLAERDYEVLLVDRDRFPSNMPQSTHLIHPLGVAYLRRWGLLEPIAARAPALDRWRVDLHGVVLEGAPPGIDGSDLSYAPRRQVLDEILVRAAEGAGAELRQGCRVNGLVFEQGRVCGVQIKGAGGRVLSERARIVVGADGPNSMVARCAGAAEYRAEPIVQSNIWSYWSGIPIEEVRLYIRERAGAFAFPSSDGAVLVAANLVYDDFVRARRSRTDAYYAMIAKVAPELAAMLRDGKQVDRMFAGCTRSFVRKASGPGWVLVGDAGMKKDPVTAQGIASAFEYAEKLADAIDTGLSGRRPLEDALKDYGQERDARLIPFYDFTMQLAKFAKPTPEQYALYRAIQGDPESTHQLFGAVALTVSPDAFFAPDNIERILQTAA